MSIRRIRSLSGGSPFDMDIKVIHVIFDMRFSASTDYKRPLPFWLKFQVFDEHVVNLQSFLVAIEKPLAVCIAQLSEEGSDPATGIKLTSGFRSNQSNDPTI